jgi:hypothetical protein
VRRCLLSGKSRPFEEAAVSKVTIREAVLMTAIVGILLMWWQDRKWASVYDLRLSAIEKKLAWGEASVIADYDRRLTEIEQGLVRYIPRDGGTAVMVPLSPSNPNILAPPGSIPTAPVTGQKDH